jgi:hypothetical protein
MAITKVTSGVIKDNSIDSDQYVDGSIDNAHLADDAVTVAKMNDSDNRHYQAIQEWVAEGNTIEAAE